MFPVTGTLLCLLGNVHQWSWRFGPSLHRTVQLAADRHPGWRTQAAPAGPVRVSAHTASVRLYTDRRFLIVTCPLSQSKSSSVFVIWRWAFWLDSRRKKTADFLRDAVETRLRMYIPYIESWPQVHWACYAPGTSASSGYKHGLDLTLWPRVLVLRQWASCSFLTTSPTAWSTSPTWWTTSGTTLETDPQTWVGPTVLDPLLLPLIPSCPLSITTHAISGLPPPRLPSTISSERFT